MRPEEIQNFQELLDKKPSPIPALVSVDGYQELRTCKAWHEVVKEKDVQHEQRLAEYKEELNKRVSGHARQSRTTNLRNSVGVWRNWKERCAE